MRERIATLMFVLVAAACGTQAPDDTELVPESLTAPATGAIAKPSAFVIVPPWASGVSHRLAQTYGTNLHVNTNTPDHSNDYYALDIDLALNEAVYPVADGTVIYAGPASGGWAPYGNIVLLNHVVGGVNYQSLYAHLTSVASISGQVSTGTVIGHAGNTGTTAVHLHLAIYRSANFSNAAGAKGPYGGASVVPEPFASCTKAGSSCENLAVGNVLVRTASAPPTCGTSCTQCVLGLRTDVLPFYQSNGWDTSCGNRDAILTNWCSLDPSGCASAKSSSTCQASCIAAGSCGNACTACVLQARTDVLPFYQSNGWDTSCGNRNAIVANWCSIDPNGCNTAKTGTCRSSCGL
jgi:murein DD-endopeptidase MepM/ murein hydrolase activator NlpD